MKTLILEDEHLAADRLQRIINDNFEDMEVMEAIDTVKDGTQYLSSHQEDLDLIFCDIHLADGSSFEIFDQVKVKTPVIFTTAYDQYSIDAFKVNSVHYLLKPLKEKEVIEAVNKLELLNAHKQPEIRLGDLKKILLNPSEEPSKRFLVKSGLKLIPKKTEDLALFYIENKVVHALDQLDGKSYLVDYSLDELEHKLLDGKLFFRVNRKQIVNMECIAAMKPHHGQRLSLDLSLRNNFDIIVSREKVTQFKKWFTD